MTFQAQTSLPMKYKLFQWFSNVIRPHLVKHIFEHPHLLLSCGIQFGNAFHLITMDFKTFFHFFSELYCTQNNTCCFSSYFEVSSRDESGVVRYSTICSIRTSLMSIGSVL